MVDKGLSECSRDVGGVESQGFDAFGQAFSLRRQTFGGQGDAIDCTTPHNRP